MLRVKDLQTQHLKEKLKKEEENRKTQGDDEFWQKVQNTKQ